MALGETADAALFGEHGAGTGVERQDLGIRAGQEIALGLVERPCDLPVRIEDSAVADRREVVAQLALLLLAHAADQIGAERAPDGGLTATRVGVERDGRLRSVGGRERLAQPILGDTREAGAYARIIGDWHGARGGATDVPECGGCGGSGATLPGEGRQSLRGVLNFADRRRLHRIVAVNADRQQPSTAQVVTLLLRQQERLGEDLHAFAQAVSTTRVTLRELGVCGRQGPEHEREHDPAALGSKATRRDPPRHAALLSRLIRLRLDTGPPRHCSVPPTDAWRRLAIPNCLRAQLTRTAGNESRIF